MDDATLARYRTQLEQRLAEVEAADDLGRSSQDVVTLDQQAVGRLSRQDALMNQSMAKATQARRETEARRIRMALRRIDDDEFGYCTDCGERISEKRLSLDATTPNCITCAQG